MQVKETRRAWQAPATLEPFVPEPTAEFVQEMRAREAPPQPQPRIPIPIPRPIPLQFGSRFIIWKQDPTVLELGRRLVYIPGVILNGPRDARIDTQLKGTTPVVRNANGDFIFHIADSPEADCAHTFAIVRQTLTLYERVRGGQPIPWAWNANGNTDVLTVHPRAGVTANAFYSRTEKALKFYYFTPPGETSPVFTCRSLDICAHEAGHAVLDGLKPGWLAFGNPPQTGALHESFGDLSALLLALSQLDQAEAFVAMTKANLHAKNFLAALAEQFGAALGQQVGLRNADNDLRLSQVGNQVHSLSQVFTGGVYDVLADIFAFEKNRQLKTQDPAHVLVDVARHVCGLVLQGVINAPNTAATFTHVVNAMLQASHAQGDPPIYRTFIRHRFALREVVVSPTPLAPTAMAEIDLADPSFTVGEDALKLKQAQPDHASITAQQDRTGCCGTMQLPEYYIDTDTLEEQLEELRESGEPVAADQLLFDEITSLEKAFA